MHKIVVIGGGGHAKVLISVINKLKGFVILGYTDWIDKGRILQTRYLGTDEVLGTVKAEYPDCFAAIGLGNITISQQRRRIKEMLLSQGFELPIIVSPHSVVNEEVIISSGSVVFDGAVVNSGTKLGECVIVNTNSTVEHDCSVGDFVHVAPGATLSGGVVIGQNCLIGTGASVLQGVNICADCLIGGGATVHHDIDEAGVYVGNPVRRIK